MGTTVSAPSQATVHLAKKTPQELYYERLDEGETRQFPTPNLLYKINMQARYAAVRETVLQYTLSVPIPKKTPLPYGNGSEEESDGPPPSPKKTDDWLGIPIFGSDFWDPHWKRDSDFVFNSEDSSWIFFLEFRC